ncbi:uncharacterized protein LOC106644272 [Copidosoma floridanum]|uniref:uncharacterized protein LOC106644272 n=1 Tax=Copidosoma floridanum TaxID=29053 RepID=UPI0006C95EFF|nr:uncharacterized protein LOC106644272 [Copidosoma floridanum]
MSPEIRHLVNPESLSETALMDHLKRRCIDLLDLKKYKKSDLIGMFKRLAMPLPQRKYNEAKCFGKRLSELRLHRKIPTAIEADTKLYE